MGNILDGKALAFTVLDEVHAQVAELTARGVAPCLAVILIGDSHASQIYVNKKQQACARVGIRSLKFELPKETSKAELLALVARLNADRTVNGILCQLPLPEQIDETAVLRAIAPEKDVDAFSARISITEDDLLPCTPAGILELIKASGVTIEGSNCVIVGRSNIVGKPLALLMIQRRATVTVCNSKTRSLGDLTKTADILVAAAGCPKLIRADMVKKGAVVIDVGINRDENNKLCGDVDFEEVREVASFITPVPGGVGPMTIAMLMRNTVRAAEKQLNA